VLYLAMIALTTPLGNMLMKAELEIPCSISSLLHNSLVYFPKFWFESARFWYENSSQSTRHPTPYTLHPTPYTLHPTPYTLHPTSYIPHPTTYTLHPTPYNLHPTFYTLHPTPYTKPYTLHPKASTLHPTGAGGRGAILQHGVRQAPPHVQVISLGLGSRILWAKDPTLSGLLNPKLSGLRI
jgi:hypothetical protein